MLTKMTVALVLSTTLMTSSIPLPTSLSRAKGLIVENDEQEVIHFKSNEERYNDLKLEVAKKTEENKKKKLEEIKRLEEEKLKEEKKRTEETHKQTFVLTYYGCTVNECGNNLGITSSGKRVRGGMVAVPKSIPFGSKIIINGETFIAEDTGNPKYICKLEDGAIRIDVFVPRLDGESDYKYENRVNNMGVKRVEGQLYLNRR